MNSTLQALGWTLIHFCWQAAAIIALYLLADSRLRNTRSQTRYLFALATLSLMFLAFVGTLGYETLRNPITSTLPFENTSASSAATSPIKDSISRIALLANASAAPRWTTLLPWLDGMWVLGVIGLSMRSLGVWLWLQRLRRVTRTRAPEAIQESFERVCSTLGIARLPGLRISELIPGPMTIGTFRTLVLLPASALLSLSPEQLEAIFAHELAHVRRADYFWNLVQTLAETLFFFHPAVWWLGKRIREQRELCCDDIAIETCSDPLIYATALFRLEDQRAAGLNLAMALDGHQSSISFRSRILRILGESAPQSPASRLRPLSLIAVCASLSFLLSPLPKIEAVAARHLPVKQILATPKELVRATTHLALQSTRATSEAGKPATLNPTQAPIAKSTSDTLDYAKQMRAAGYDADLDNYAILQKAGVTPAYAQEMAGLGLGTPSAALLLELKKENVTGQYLTAIRAAGLEPRGFAQLMGFRIFNVTPEFITGMKAAGFASIPPGKLQALRALGVTPEDAKTMKQQYPNTTVQDLIESRASQNTENKIGAPSVSHRMQLPAFSDAATPPTPPHGSRRQPGPWWANSGLPPGSQRGNSPPPLPQ
ncbi:M56 family metallopeptidase [Granulicella sp. WH15]|uniref:M56 family metallopeptidase n=1 Tax=Granulicella sp. WH15 TaxID=2602070 RepID=UPI0013675881|nr:M56 family metallopeptidase [Granulicella sp. WH15]QHN03661.1 M56 family metallopeptidase [Granulicella sp. WH15]